MPVPSRPGDTPVVHAALGGGRYGFRDRLALGDASFIIGPPTRTTAACFSACALRPELIKTRKRVDAINAVFLRAALREVACHPDDARAVRQARSRLDRLPRRFSPGRRHAWAPRTAAREFPRVWTAGSEYAAQPWLAATARRSTLSTRLGERT